MVIVIVAVLAAICMPAIYAAMTAGRKAASTSNLRQFGAAVGMYTAEHNQTFPLYRVSHSDTSVTWWFGYEAASSMTAGEGDRSVDKTQSPLYPYLHQGQGVEVDPGFVENKSIVKPKYKGASYGYGYNVYLGGGWMGTAPPTHLTDLSSASRVIEFATCAQVNSFEPPATPSHPLIEEFFGLDNWSQTIHFRFGREALVLFVDGHVQSMPIFQGTEDQAIPNSAIGRVTDFGSMDMLK